MAVLSEMVLSDLLEQAAEPQEEAAGTMRPGSAQSQLLRLRQQTGSNSQTQRAQNRCTGSTRPSKEPCILFIMFTNVY